MRAKSVCCGTEWYQDSQNCLKCDQCGHFCKIEVAT